jgi:tetratricopeptide (TPR) repeat protein
MDFKFWFHMRLIFPKTIMNFFKSSILRHRLFFALTTLFMMVPASNSFGTTAKGGYFSVQVASYINEAAAHAEIAALKVRGYRFSCYAVNIPKKGTWYRVATGKYQSRKAAITAGSRLKEKKIIHDFVIVRNKPGEPTAASAKTTPKAKAIPGKSVISNRPEPARIPAPPKAKPAFPDMQTGIASATVVKSAETTAPPVVLVAPPGKPPVQPSRQAPALTLIASSGPPAAVALVPAIPFHDGAMGDFIAQRYEDALPKFKKMAATGNNQTALRRMADCYYFLGCNGNKQYLLKAIEQYRMMIKNSPDDHRENAQALYRLADGYRVLHFYYEALAGFKDLCRKYPESRYAPDAVFMVGKMNYQVNRFNRAIEKLRTYIERFPGGRHIKDAHFAMGSCYSKLRQLNDAKRWYTNALKKWPDLADIPEDSLSQLGATYYANGRYNDALKVFFVYLNLFPESRDYKAVFCKVARIFEKTGQLPMALKLSSLIIERYPDTRQALESAILMANIGAEHPALKLPPAIFTGRGYYHDPLSTYDEIAQKNTDLGMAEELAFRKGDAQLKKGMYRQAFDTCRLFLKKFPAGPRRNAVEKNFVKCVVHRVGDQYSKKNHMAVAHMYFISEKKILMTGGDFDLLSKIGNSLEKIGLSEQAVEIFKKMRERFPTNQKIHKIRLAEAQIDTRLGRDKEAREILKKLLVKPWGVSKKTLQSAGKLIGDICFRKHLPKEAGDYYLKALNAGDASADMADIRKKYADALKESGRYAEALANYQMVLKSGTGDSEKYRDAVIPGAYEGAGDCLYHSGAIRKAISMYEKILSLKPPGSDQQKFILYKTGRGYARLDNGAMAEESFNRLTNDTDDEFWPAIVDNYLTHKNWLEKYSDYL